MTKQEGMAAAVGTLLIGSLATIICSNISTRAQLIEIIEEERATRDRIILLEDNLNARYDQQLLEIREHIKAVDEELDKAPMTVYIYEEPKEEELVIDASKERLPEGDTNTFRCMDFRTITDHTSVQWKMQGECLTDPETGIRYLTANGKKYLCAAMGSAYGQDLGDTFHITLQNGHEFDVVYAEFKNPVTDPPDYTFFGHPDVNYDGEATTSVIEFVYDWTAAPQNVIDAGTMSALDVFGGLYGDGGNIVSIKYLGRIWE